MTQRTSQAKRIKILLPILVLAVVVAALISMSKKEAMYQKDSGFVFGTVYNITYQSEVNLKAEIEAELKKVDNSLSMFNSESVISKINKNESVTLDSMFLRVFAVSSQVYKESGGAFDITVAPLVNVWGFGFKKGVNPDKNVIDSLRSIIGFDKVSLVNGRVVKADKRIMLDCSAVAKGFAVDVVADFLRSKGIRNFMVEIGGEIVTCGRNSQRQPWRIGVTKPTDDSLSTNTELQTVLNLTDKAMATSGNYRNFYYKDGKKYAHTIDPKTGMPVQHNILSATVIANDCATADAYATSFMVLGLDGARKVLEHHPELMVYFIYSDAKGKNSVWFSPELKDKVSE